MTLTLFARGDISSGDLIRRFVVVVIAGGFGLAVIHTFEGRLVTVFDLFDLGFAALVALWLRGVALVLIVFVWHIDLRIAALALELRGG